MRIAHSDLQRELMIPVLHSRGKNSELTREQNGDFIEIYSVAESAGAMELL